MLRRRIFAAAFTIIGLGLTLAPDRYDAPAYSTLFRVASPRAWGAAFLIVAVIAAVRKIPRTFAVAVVAGHLFAWSAGLIHANLVDHTASPTAWVWSTTLAVLVMLSPAWIDR